MIYSFKIFILDYNILSFKIHSGMRLTYIIFTALSIISKCTKEYRSHTYKVNNYETENYFFIKFN